MADMHRALAQNARAAQLRARTADNPGMHLHDIGEGLAVLELPDHPGPDRVELELLVWWGGGEPTRAAWVWSQTGRVAGWAEVGVA